MSRLGKRTIGYDAPVFVKSHACMAGHKESEGPLGATFDVIIEDDLLGQKSWELAESEMLRRTVELCLQKESMNADEVHALLAGDLNAQIMSAGFAARELRIPFLGLYGACSTMIEALLVGAEMVAAGSAGNAVCAASSHFCTAERQFRSPLELGTQRPLSAQWTATAAGAMLLEGGTGTGTRLTHGTMGRVIDLKVKDANQMGAAMAPAVCDTICGHFEDTGRDFSAYDLIVTGDLGAIGLDILKELLTQRGVIVNEASLMDCGASMYAPEQDAHAGGSGCGCIASVLSGMIAKKLRRGELRRVLAVGSGALLSAVSTQQGETIPAIAYAVALEGDNRNE